jgi:hypothetical protein
MTPRQKLLYWRTWSRVRRLYTDIGGYSPAEADAQRHALTRDALGRDKSSADFTNRDLDVILDHFAAVLVLETGPSTAPARSEEMPRRRLIWAIEKTGLGDAYLDAISRDEFRTTPWRTLPETDLVRLRFTAVSRSRSKARAAAISATAQAPP